MHSAAPFIHETHELSELANAARHCEGCPLYREAATAAKSLLGNDFRVSRHRGAILRATGLTSDGDPALVVTIHPPAVLRGPSETREEAFDRLVADLRTAYATTRTVRSDGSAGPGRFIPAANPVRR